MVRNSVSIAIHQIICRETAPNPIHSKRLNTKSIRDDMEVFIAAVQGQETGIMVIPSLSVSIVQRVLQETLTIVAKAMVVPLIKRKTLNHWQQPLTKTF